MSAAPAKAAPKVNWKAVVAETGARAFFEACRERLHLARRDRKGRCRVSGLAQYALIDYLTTATLANARKKGTAPAGWLPFTNAHLCDAIGCSERVLIDAVRDGQLAGGRGLFEVLTQAQAKKRGFSGGHAQAKYYRVCPENWATAPLYEAPPANLTVMPAPEEEEEEGEPEADEADIKIEPHQPIILAAGKKSRPVPWIPAAKQYAFDCSRVSVGLSISPTFNRGVVRFLICQQVAEGTPEPGVRGGAAKSTAAGSRGEPPAMVRQNLIDELAARNLPIAPDHADRILTVLKGTSLPYFIKEVDEQRERARARHKEFHKGLLLKAAADAAGSFPASLKYQQLTGGTPEPGFRGGTPKIPPAGETDFARQARRLMERRGRG